jgi:hypothetical protein
MAWSRRWPHTGSVCRPTIRFRNADSPRCSDAGPVRTGRGGEHGAAVRGRRSWGRHGALPAVRLADRTLDGVVCTWLDAAVAVAHSQAVR